MKGFYNGNGESEIQGGGHRDPVGTSFTVVLVIHCNLRTKSRGVVNLRVIIGTEPQCRNDNAYLVYIGKRLPQAVSINIE